MNEPTSKQPIPAIIAEVNAAIEERVRKETAETLAAIDEREAALLRLSFLPETHSLSIYCHRTGVLIAHMDLIQQAGKMPYLSQWKDSVAYHPLFSLSQRQILGWTRKNWDRIFKDATIEQVSPIQQQQLCIAFMAVLHTLDSIDQQHPALPSFQTVIVNMQRLIQIAYWHNVLDSSRFKFPTLKITKLNNNYTLRDIAAYLAICESKKKDWESSKEAKLEEEKTEMARRAEKAVAGSHIRAVSKKHLWNWFIASIADSNGRKYQLPEWQEWKTDSEKLWFASDTTILSHYSLDDIQSIEEVYYCDCEIGSAVSHAFTKELERIKALLLNHEKIFSIDWEATMKPKAVRVDQAGNPIGSSVMSDKINCPDPGVRPTPAMFSTKLEFLKAQAKWDVLTAQRAAWIEKYGQPDDSNDTTGETK